MAQSVHCGQHQLTATIKCLQQLSEERCGSKYSACLRIAKQAYWLSPGDELFKDCTHGTGDSHTKATKCEKLPQQILRGYVNPKSIETPPIEGAITFGERRLQKPIPPAQPAPQPTSQKIQHINGTALRTKTISAPEVDANLANADGNAMYDNTGEANGNTAVAHLSKALASVHRRKSTFSGLISRMAAKSEAKWEKKLAPPPRDDVPCELHAGPSADHQEESNVHEKPNQIKCVNGARESFHQPTARYLTEDKNKRPKHSHQGIISAILRQIKGVSVAHEQPHRPMSQPSRFRAAHHSLHQATSEPPMQKEEERYERDSQHIFNAQNLQVMKGQVQSSLDQATPVENTLRRSVRRSNLAHRNGKRSHQDRKKRNEETSH